MSSNATVVVGTPFTRITDPGGVHRLAVDSSAVIYDASGNPVAISPNVPIPAGTSAILVAGSDGTNARLFSVDATGKLAIQNPSNLDVALSTRATALAQTDGSQKTQVVNGANTLGVNASGQAAIQNPSNLDVALSTRLADSTFTARINTLGQKTSANSTPVVLASDQSDIRTQIVNGANTLGINASGQAAIQNPPNLDVALSTRAAAITQTDGNQKTQVVNGANTLGVNASGQAAIQNPSNLDVALSTRLADSTFTARINTLGQKTSANSTPVVLASDQSEITVKQGTAAALSGYWPARITDGTNTMPTGDATARSIYQNVAQWLGSTAPTVGQKAMASSIPVTLASDQTALPVSYGVASYVSQNNLWSGGAELNMALANTDNTLLLLRNPVASGKTLYLYLSEAGTSVVNVNVVFKLYANPTVTANGSAVGTYNRNVGGAGASVGLLTSLPTVTALGNKLQSSTVGQNCNSLALVEDFSIAIQPGNSLLITGSPSSNNREAILLLSWQEV